MMKYRIETGLTYNWKRASLGCRQEISVFFLPTRVLPIASSSLRHASFLSLWRDSFLDHVNAIRCLS